MKTTLELDFGYIEGKIEDEILDRAASKILHRNSDNFDILDGFRKRVNQIRDEILREKLTPEIEEIIQGPIYQTNEYGEPRGEPISLREYIVKFAQKHLQRKNTDNFGGRRRGETILEQIIREEFEGAMRKEIKQSLDAAREAAKKAIEEHAATVLRETIQRAGSKL